MVLILKFGYRVHAKVDQGNFMGGIKLIGYIKGKNRKGSKIFWG